MTSGSNVQASRLADLIRTATAGTAHAERGTLFCSRAGLALVNAAFDLFECDALYDLACDVAQEAGCTRDSAGTAA